MRYYNSRMSEVFYAVVELFYDIVQKVIIKKGSEHESGAKRFLFIVSVLGLAAGSIFWGRQILAEVKLWMVFQPLETFAPIWLPLVLGITFVNYWMRYIRAEYILEQGSVLLEIKLPREIEKSPLAMELVFISLYQTGAATYIETYFKGKVRPWFSFELASFNGQIHFYIWGPKKFKNLIEAQIYAQYPTVEIYEVPDYMAAVHHDPVNVPMWATYFTYMKPHPYPIRTYVDYGLHDNPKEEYKIDPMTSVLEYLGSLRQGEQAWIQILVQAHKKLGLKDGALFPKADWKHEIKHEVEKIRKDSMVKTKTKEGELPGFPNPTKGQQEVIGALERSAGKWPFETAIRGIYISTKEAFSPISITGLIGSFRQYSANENLNGFKLGWFTDFDYPWQDFHRHRRSHEEKEMLEAVKLRSFFQFPFKNFHQSPLILTTEELATIYHFPGAVAATPTIQRIPSKKVEPPPNLPV